MGPEWKPKVWPPLRRTGLGNTIETAPGCSDCVLVPDPGTGKWEHGLLGGMALVPYGLLARGGRGGKVQTEERQSKVLQSPGHKAGVPVAYVLEGPLGPSTHPSVNVPLEEANPTLPRSLPGLCAHRKPLFPKFLSHTVMELAFTLLPDTSQLNHPSGGKCYHPHSTDKEIEALESAMNHPVCFS